MLGKCKCGQDANTGINNGKCDGCIGAYIDGLETELQKHQWISVEDGLPEEGSGVFICDYEYEGVGEVWACCYGRGRFNLDGHDMTDRVTYWKPITLPTSIEKESE
jgi:hypothetical protein